MLFDELSEHKCQVCNKEIFSNEACFERHLKNHENNKDQPC